ncbi:MAG: T9SS type A sorting domain-containing protein [Bacteroidales bacterium]|nr:T9SS type A sorting domain-containing protein [Bacteroidales bacterium]
MKKVTFIILSLGLTFGAFAQKIASPFKAESKSVTPKTELPAKHPHGFMPAGTVNAVKQHALKAEDFSVSDITSFEDWTNGGFSVKYTVTMKEGMYYSPFVLEKDSVDALYPNGDEDIIEETRNTVDFYKQIYELFYGMEWNDALYFETMAGEQVVGSLAANTDYTLIVVYKDAQDNYGVVKENFTTGETALTGSAAMLEAKAENIGATKADLTFKKNDQTARYFILMALKDTMEAYGLGDAEGAASYIDANGHSNMSFLAVDTTITVGNDIAVGNGALMPESDYLVWLFPYNGNDERGEVTSISFTTVAVASQTGVAKADKAEVSNITMTDAFLTFKFNDQTNYYYIFFDKKATFDQYNADDEDSVKAIIASNPSNFMTVMDTTFELGAEDLSDQYALTPNTEYLIYLIPFNAKQEAGEIKRLSFTTESSKLSGVAKATLEVDAEELPLTWTVTVNDQTDHFDFYCNWVDTLQSLIDYMKEYDGSEWTLEDAALDDINYYVSNYGVNCTYTNSEDVNKEWGTGWFAVAADVPWVEGSELFAVVVPYNGNYEKGEVTTLQFKVGGVGINTVEDGVLVNVYPNPATDYIQVIGLNGMQKVEILNTLGQTVYSENTKTNGLNINVQNFEKGTYFVNVTSNGKVTMHKVVVK